MNSIMKFCSMLLLCCAAWTTEAQSMIKSDSITLSIYEEYQYLPDTLAKDSTRILDHTLTKAIIVLKNVNNIGDIAGFEIKLGANLGQANFLSKEFPLGPQGELPDGQSFSQDNHIILMSLGKNLPPGRKYCQLRIKDRAGNFSNPILF